MKRGFFPNPCQNKGLLFFLGFLMLGGNLADSVWANGPPIQSESGFVTGLQGAAIRSFFKEVRKTKLLRDGDEITDPMDRAITVRMVPVAVPYEVLSNRLILGAIVPYLDKQMRLTQSGTRRTLRNEGLGDLTLFGKIGLFQRDVGPKTTRVAGKVAIKLPTAKDKATDDSGARLPIGLQLGTGATDIAVGGIVTHLRQRWGVNGGLHHTFKSRANNIKLGDALNYDIALAYRVWPKVYEIYPSPQWNLFLEWNGLWEQKREDQGKKVNDTGGNTVLLSPGIQFMGGRTWLLEVSYQLPILQNLNGTQLGIDRTFLFGFRWLIG